MFKDNYSLYLEILCFLFFNECSYVNENISSFDVEILEMKKCMDFFKFFLFYEVINSHSTLNIFKRQIRVKNIVKHKKKNRI
jgi:hypothetical protein